MRQIRLKRLDIENFKGLRCLTAEFDDELTQIIGANGVGKTSVHDAYLWLLLGIDSANRSNFAIQPLDNDSKTIDHLTTSVTGVFDFDGIVHEFRRSLHQTWTRRRGAKEDVLTGNETEYFIDSVPHKASEYSAEIARLFCSTDDFKLVSSIKAFGQLDMKSKRKKLIQMAGEMPELINEKDYPRLSKYYATVKSVDAIKKQVKYEMDGLKEKQAAIPIKITENERDMPSGIDFGSLREQLASKEAELESIDAMLQKEAASKDGVLSEWNAMNEELQKLNAELVEIEESLSSQRSAFLTKINDEIVKSSSELKETQSDVAILKRDIEDLKSRIASAESRKDALGKQWVEKNKEAFPDSILTECPTCHRPYDEEDIAKARNEAIRSFNAGKAGVLARIESEGDQVVKQLSSLNKELVKKEALLEESMSYVESWEKQLAELKKDRENAPTIENLKTFSKEYQKVLEKRNVLSNKALFNAPKASENEVALKNKKETLKKEIAVLYTELAKEKDIAKIEERRTELESENAVIATRIAELDGVMYEILVYQKAYIELVESKVSSMFRLVTWKMYSKNITNDGETEICECLVNGVPVSTNVNTAGAVNAGIDIINALSRWLGVSFPLWIDGKESVTSLIETDAQLITMKVVENQMLKIVK